MKRKLFIGLSFIIATALSSCEPSPIEKSIAFLNKNDAIFYYFGEESKVFNKLEKIQEFSTSGCPKPTSRFSAYVIDIEYERNLLSVELLNQVFKTFDEKKEVCVFLINYNDDLSILNGTLFRPKRTRSNIRASDSYPNPKFYFYCKNNGPYVSSVEHRIGFINEGEYTVENYHSVILQTYHSFVEKLLLGE